MKSGISFVPSKTMDHVESSKNNQFFKIKYVLINLNEKKNSKQKTGKINALESKTNLDKAAETITALNSKNILNTVQTIEFSEQGTINQKKHKPKIKQQKYCKLFDEFTNEFKDIEKKKLNNSYCINVDLMKKKEYKFRSMNKNNINRNNNIKNITNIPKRTWLSNCIMNSAIRKYKTLSATIKNKHLNNNKIRKIPKHLEKKEIKLVNKNNKNKYFTPCCKKVCFYTSENNKNDTKNFECNEVAQRRPGHSKVKINNSNEAKVKKITKKNITQVNFNKKKNEILDSFSNIKINPESSNNLKKFSERKEKLNTPCSIHSNKKIVNIYIKELKTKNKNKGQLKKINNINVLAENKSLKKKELFIKDIEYNHNILGGYEISEQLSKKKQITLENSSNNYKLKKKNFIKLMNCRFSEIEKNIKN